MRASNQIRSFAAKIASTQPAMAFDLMSLADKVAQDEQAQQEQQEQGQAQQGQKAQQKQGGQMPQALKEHAEKKKEEKEEKGEDQGQKKQAYQTLRSAVIRLASQNHQARIALQPVLHLIKQIG